MQQKGVQNRADEKNLIYKIDLDHLNYYDK